MKELKVKLFKLKIYIIIEYPIFKLGREERKRFFYNRCKNSQLTHTHTHTHTVQLELGLAQIKNKCSVCGKRGYSFNISPLQNLPSTNTQPSSFFKETPGLIHNLPPFPRNTPFSLQLPPKSPLENVYLCVQCITRVFASQILY